MAVKHQLFMSNIAEKIPLWGRVIKGSERAYVGYLNKLRVDVFTRMADDLVKLGYDPETDLKAFKDAAKFINIASYL